MSRSFLRLVVVLLGCAVSPAASQAQGLGPVPFPGAHELKVAHQAEHHINLRKRPNLSIEVDATIDGDYGPFDLSAIQSTASGQFLAPINDRAAVIVNGVFRETEYLFDGTTDWFDRGPSQATTPFDPLWLTMARVIGLHAIDKQWGVIAGSEVKFQWEDGADAVDGGVGEFFLAGGWLWEKKVAVALGAGMKVDMEDGSIGASPVFRIQWRINEDWSVETQGVGGRVTRHFGKGLSLSFQGRSQSTNYVLDDRGDLKKATFTDSRFPVGFHLHWKPLEHFVLDAQAGILVVHDLKTKEKNGDKIDSRDQDRPTPYLGLRLRYQF